MRVSPPQPHFSDSRPAYRRRWRSSSKLANSTIAARSSLGTRSASAIGPTSPGAASRARRAPSCCALRVRSALTGNLVAAQLAFLDQLAQRILGADVQQVVQLLAVVPRGRVVDHRFGGGKQGAGGREPHVAERPQSVLVEVDQLIKGVVAAAMGIAGAVGEFLELAERGASGGRAECRHHLGQRGDGLLMKQVDERGGGVLGRPHSDTITNDMIAIVPQRRAPSNRNAPESRPPQTIPTTQPTHNGLVASIYRDLYLRRPLADSRRLRLSITGVSHRGRQRGIVRRRPDCFRLPLAMLPPDLDCSSHLVQSRRCNP